jgi:6-oxo-cyclohex-1-ene-carbonyl-CoA hydrolase
MFEFKNHELAPDTTYEGADYELKPCLDKAGKPVEGLFNAWITLNNPSQLNSYTTAMVKGVILGFRKASEDRRVNAVVFTGAGSRAFCTGGNTKEYAEYYSGRPGEYMRYMRLFNDMVTAILMCDKPVICRVNGMRIAGGQEIGMACDFTVASDLAMFGQAGPKHGSAPDGGSTDFLPLFVGIENAMQSCTLCEMWSAHRALQLGLITEIVPALVVDDEFVPNPMVVTDHCFDAMGLPAYGTYKGGSARADAKAVMKAGRVDLSRLDEAVDRLCTNLLYMMPGCVTKTVSSVRKHKLEHWDRNKETNRIWLGLNMMTEANAGFRAFNEAVGRNREVDFVGLRQRLANGEKWGPELIEAILPKAQEGTVA